MTEQLLMTYKVLYVEDDDYTRDALQYYLKKRVGKLMVAKNGIEGLEKFKHFSPDMVITDLRMPEMGGLELARNIRQLTKDCAIIVITAFSDVETVIKAVDLGIDKYVQKPLDTKELLEAMVEVAKKSLMEKDATEHIGRLKFKNLQEKRSHEERIQKQMALFIKQYSGKGPQLVRSFLKGDYIEIEVLGGVTVMEKSLLQNPKNNHLVNFSRETLYLDRSGMIEHLISQVLGISCIFEKVEVNLKKERDLIILSVKQEGQY